MWLVLCDYYILTPAFCVQVSSYSLEVTATDMGEPSLSSTAQINVHVSDANDNPPVFSQAKYEAVIQVSGYLSTVCRKDNPPVFSQAKHEASFG